MLVFVSAILGDLDGDGRGLPGANPLGAPLVLLLLEVIPGAQGRVGHEFLLAGQVHAQFLDEHHDRRRDGQREEGSQDARIMSICDIYDALRSKRPYKPALDHPQAMEIITAGDGRTHPGHFAPAVFECFRHHHTTFRDIFQAHAGA